MTSQRVIFDDAVYESFSSTVASIVNNYVREDSLAKAAQISAEQAQEAYPRLVKNLARTLELDDYDCKIIEYHGYRRNKDGTMAAAFDDVAANNISHAVVQVGYMAIDPCRLRMGQHYPLPLSYPIKDALKYWTSFVDRTHLTKLTPDEMRERVKQSQTMMTNNQFAFSRDAS